MKTYYIYHIPNHKWPNGLIGKIGCTDDLERRMADQYATKYEVLETHLDIYIASDREIELQKQYGYPVDKTPYWKMSKLYKKEACSRGGKKTSELGYLMSYKTKEHQSMAGRKGGLVAGPRNVASGQINIARAKSIEVIKKPIIQFDSDGNFIREWESIIESANELGLQSTHISRVCKGKRNRTGGFIFKYKV